MKKLIGLCVLAAALAHFSSAGAESYYLGGVRLALIEDPFRVKFQGGSTELSREKIAQAIKLIAGIKGWRVVNQGDDRMELTTIVRDEHVVSLDLGYDAGGYVIRYVQSTNLLYEEQKRQGSVLRVIHKNYNGWIRELVTGINSSLGFPARVAIGFAPLDEVDAVPFLDEKGREAYRRFLAAPAPRAFAVANGSWGLGVRDNLIARRNAGDNDVAEDALTLCNRSGGGKCRLYAIDDRVVWEGVAAGAPLGSRPLAGADFVAHAGRLREIRANPDTRHPFTLSVTADGKTGRICRSCPTETGKGTMTVKAADGVVCFQWEKIDYPDSGCFQIVPAGGSGFEMRGTNSERSVVYSLGK